VRMYLREFAVGHLEDVGCLDLVHLNCPVPVHEAGFKVISVGPVS
jgi:hypothetical protein